MVVPKIDPASFYGNVWSLTRQFAKHENEPNLLQPLGIQKLKGFQLLGDDFPPPADQGLCPWN